MLAALKETTAIARRIVDCNWKTSRSLTCNINRLSIKTLNFLYETSLTILGSNYWAFSYRARYLDIQMRALGGTETESVEGWKGKRSEDHNKVETDKVKSIRKITEAVSISTQLHVRRCEFPDQNAVKGISRSRFIDCLPDGGFLSILLLLHMVTDVKIISFKYFAFSHLQLNLL